MFGERYLVAGFLIALLLSPLNAVDTKVQSQKELEAKSLGPYQPIARGHTLEIKYYGKRLIIQSAEVNPPDGVKVMGVDESSPDPKDAETQEKDVKNWTITLSASPDAKVGSRSLILRSSDGRSKSDTINVVSHVPKISDLKITGTHGGGLWVDFELAVFDEAGDISPEKKPYCRWSLSSSGGYSSNTKKAKQVVMKDSKNSIVYFSSSQSGVRGRGTAIFKVQIYDNNADKPDEPWNNSNQLEAVVTFK